MNSAAGEFRAGTVCMIVKQESGARNQESEEKKDKIEAGLSRLF
jgi:hypothetical protein